MSNFDFGSYRLIGARRAQMGSIRLKRAHWCSKGLIKRAHWCSKVSKGLNKAQKVSLGLERLVGGRRTQMGLNGFKGVIGARRAQ